ncbi:MAG: 30S ribosomal protein S16 [Candidatus Dadabacteria bacterium]|nr:MAG: 30S ribosomal protein S16 [Candidatus Dadabacteria bacterium]
MSVRIRLQRKGRKKRPFYRIVAADRQAPRDGRFIELLGTYDPLQDPPAIRLKQDRVDYWLSQGAQPTDTAERLITAVREGKELRAREKPSHRRRKAEKAAVREAAATEATQASEPAAEEAPAEEEA